MMKRFKTVWLPCVLMLFGILTAVMLTIWLSPLLHHIDVKTYHLDPGGNKESYKEIKNTDKNKIYKGENEMLKSLTKLQENKRGANGITLVALVVTIVVLLILAGITIAQQSVQ